MKKSEFLEKLSKGLIIGGAVIAFSSIIAVTATTINGSCKQKKLDKVYEMLQAEKAPIVYQMQEDEIKAISDKFESGEYSFIEATAKLNEVQSDDYVKEKTEELAKADERYADYEEQSVAADKMLKTGLGMLGGTVLGAAIMTTSLIPVNALGNAYEKERAEEKARQEAEKASGEPPKETEGQENSTDEENSSQEVENQEKTTDEEETEM